MFALKSDPKQWSETRKLGQKTFVWRYGVLGWGVSTAVFFTALTGYKDGWSTMLINLPIAFAVFPLAGIAWGRFMWWFCERMHGGTASE
ncbi:MAG: hypothetical protein AB7I57_22000 [Pirellulales bacterium]